MGRGATCIKVMSTRVAHNKTYFQILDLLFQAYPFFCELCVYFAALFTTEYLPIFEKLKHKFDSMADTAINRYMVSHFLALAPATHLKADCKCSSVCCKVAKNQSVKAIVVMSAL